MYIFGIKYPAQKETERFLIFVVCCFFPHHVIFDNVCIRAMVVGGPSGWGNNGCLSSVEFFPPPSSDTCSIPCSDG